MIAGIKFVKDFLVSIFIMISMIFTPIYTMPYIAKDPDSVNLVFNVVSDVHIETNNTDTYKIFKQVLTGIKNNSSCNANVLLGDNTMNGQATESFLFFNALDAAFDSSNTFVALGNHDIGNGEGDYDKFIAQYINYRNRLINENIQTPYYYRVVNGCYMIFLASEDLCVNSFYVSDEQIEWLKSILDEASESQNPIFVFSHHPLQFIGNEKNYVVLDMLNSYNNVFNIHGHTHMSYFTYQIGNITCANLSRVIDDGVGLTIEVYDDTVLFRERDFVKGVWLSEISFDINNCSNIEEV